MIQGCVLFRISNGIREDQNLKQEIIGQLFTNVIKRIKIIIIFDNHYRHKLS